MTIPRILHLTSRSVPLRGFEKRIAVVNARVLVGWDIRMWSDRDNSRLVSERYPELASRFEALPFGVSRADVVRLLYVHAFGGWYSDCDYEWLKDPTAEFPAAAAVLPYSRDGDDLTQAKIGNAVFGSEAGHPVWLQLATGILQQPLTGLTLSTVERFSGPEYVTSRAAAIASYGDISMPERRFFHPAVTAAARAGGSALGLHHTQGSWRRKHLRGALARRLRAARAPA